MPSKHQWEDYGPQKISMSTIKQLCAAYPSTVSAELKDLDDMRMVRMPGLLEQRRSDGDCYLTRAELSDLMEWKLKRGTYRIGLAKLIASNDEETVITTTRQAFKRYRGPKNANNSNDDEDGNNEDIDEDGLDKSLQDLCVLKGVGPATASLIMSCYDPSKVPFFSDELYRWSRIDESTKNPWDRKITYSRKELRELIEAVRKIRDRLNSNRESAEEAIGALDLEKVARVLYQKDKDKGRDDGYKRISSASGHKPVIDDMDTVKMKNESHKRDEGKSGSNEEGGREKKRSRRR